VLSYRQTVRAYSTSGGQPSDLSAQLPGSGGVPLLPAAGPTPCAVRHTHPDNPQPR